MRAFAAYLEKIEFDDLGHLSPLVLSGFVADLKQRIAWPSLRNACGVLKVFLRYLHREGVLPKDLSHRLEVPQTYRLSKIPRSITWDEVRRMLEVVDRRTSVPAITSAPKILCISFYSIRLYSVLLKFQSDKP